MSAIRTMCPHCITPVDLDPSEILLIGTPSGADTSSYAYVCRACERVTVAAVSVTSFALLVTSGVQVQTSQPAASSHSGDGFTLDDAIDFHLLLRTDDWFMQLLPKR
jgi:hypothetical protein